MKSQALGIRKLKLLGIVTLLFLAGCGGGTSQSLSNPPSGSNPAPANSTNPVPMINSLDPSCAPFGAGAFTLSVNGSNFVANSVVRWNGSDLPTTVFNASNATAQIPASDIAATGTPALTVFNPAPGGGSSNPLTFSVAVGGVSPQSIAVDPTGKFAYVANEGCSEAFVGNVSMYAINPTTGSLTSIGSPVAADSGAYSVTVDPSGKFTYVANSGTEDTCGSVSAYAIDPTNGALTSIGSVGAPGNTCTPYSVSVHPSGKFAYVANEGGFTPTTVSMYTIDATTGTLTFIGTIASGGRAISVTVDPFGKFAYVANIGVNVSMYSINVTTGALTSIGTISAGVTPTSLAALPSGKSIAGDPSGRFVYVVNPGSPNPTSISMYSLNATTGALTSIGTISAGVAPTSIAINPSGKFAYVTNSGSNDISMFSIDAAEGTLTPLGTVAAGTTPSSVAVDPRGIFAYVTNSGSNDVSMFSIDAATGALTFIGTIGT